MLINKSNKFYLKDRSTNKFKMYINQFKLNSSSSSSSLLSLSSIDFMFLKKKLNYSFIFILIFLLITTVSASSISRNEEINHDFICANNAHDTGDCQIFAREKWGNKKDERSLCCLLLEVKECVLRKREEYCRGEIMEAFRKSHNEEVNQLKSKKCKPYLQNSNCDEEFEIWTLAAMIMLCLISGMACITLGVLYTKK